MIDVKKLIIKNYKCHCGNTHISPVDKIIIEPDARQRTAEYIKDILPSGHIALVSFNDVNYSYDVRHNLRKAGYKISEIFYEPFTRATELNANRLLELDESIRLIIAVGSGSISEMVKFASYKLSIPNVIIITAPSTDSWFLPKVYLDDEQGLKEYKGTSPSLLIADTSITLPRALISASIGNLYSRMIGIFDFEYRNIISGNKYCKSITEDLKSDIKQFFNEPFDYSNIEQIKRLIVCNLDVALKLGYLSDNPPVMSEDMLIRLLRLKKYNCPSAPLIAAYSLNLIYRNWLYDSRKDLFIPPERSAYYEILNKYYNMDKMNTIRKVNEYDEKLYLKVAFTTDNMRKELINELDSMIPDSSKMAKNIIKIFIDNGFHMSEIIDFKVLMSYIALAGELSPDYSLIKQIDKTGILCHYVI